MLFRSSGEAPIVDVQSSTSQTQFEKATIEALPGAGRLTVLSDILPGATLTQEFNRGVGGTSGITGAFVAALMLGIADVGGKYYAHEVGAFFIYAVMVIVLVLRPQGLFARPSGR